MSTDGVDSADRGHDSGGSGRNSEPDISDKARESLNGGSSDKSGSDHDPGDVGGSDDDNLETSGGVGSGDDDDEARADEARTGADAASNGYNEVGTNVPAEEVDPNEPTAEERAATQERMALEGQAARQAFENRQAAPEGYEFEAYGTTAPEAEVVEADLELEPEEIAAVESPVVGNTPGADFVYGEPLTEEMQAEVLEQSQTTVKEAAVTLGEIDGLIEADVIAAELAFESEVYEVPSGIPGVPSYVETEFDADAARAEIEASYAAERRGVEYDAQVALNNAALVAGTDGLDQMRNAAVMAMDEAGFGDTEIEAVTTAGVLGSDGYHRADAFARAADAWGTGGAQDPAHVGGDVYGPDPEYSTEVITDMYPGNDRVAGNLDDITGRLEAAGQPELAADMRLHAVTQLGDAIYAGETGNHADVMAVVRDGEPVSDLGRATQASLSRTPEGQAALEQFQNLMDPLRLDGMNLRTGEPRDEFIGISPQRPGSPERPMGGYPEVIRETLGPHIDAAIEARGVAAVGLAAALVVPDATDLAIVAGLAGAARLSRFGDEIADGLTRPGNDAGPVDELLDAFRPNRPGADIGDVADTRRTPGAVEQRRQEVLGGHPNAEILSGHRGPTGQIDHFTVRVDGQTWHVPAGRTLDDVPDLDPIGDRIQEFATDAANRWSPTKLTKAERDAIAAAHDAGEHYLGNILRAQAKGRWVETEVRGLMKADGTPNDRPARGLDYVDPDTNLQYDILSGTLSNIQRHARREGEEMFRMITF